uniref:Methyl-CpG-binding domain-containing protein 11-like n=1 Tax=Rhizophora mucronata TaxID=61149 RepID=A0A2P2IY17_RHIMU
MNLFASRSNKHDLILPGCTSALWIVL